MADQIKQNNINPNLEIFAVSDRKEIVNYNSHLEASRLDKTVTSEDELIAALQNQRENRRARQVFEWENVRRETPNYQFWPNAL